MSAPCNRPALAYNAAGSLRNSKRAEPRTRQTCGFFVPAFHGQGAPADPVSCRMEFREIPNTRSRLVSVLSFHPAPTALVGFSFRLNEETDMTNNALPLSVCDLITDINSIAISLDFIAHGIKEFHPGAHWLLIRLSDQCCDLIEGLEKFTPGDKSPPCEIDFTVNAEEAALIDRWALKWGVPRDEAATRLAREALASIEPPTKKANP